MIHFFKCSACDYEFKVGAFSHQEPIVRICPKCTSSKDVMHKGKAGHYIPQNDQAKKYDDKEMERRAKILSETIPLGTIMGTDIVVQQSQPQLAEPVIATIQKKSLWKHMKGDQRG